MERSSEKADGNTLGKSEDVKDNCLATSRPRVDFSKTTPDKPAKIYWVTDPPPEDLTEEELRERYPDWS